jgi:SWIM zinc finger
MFSYLTSVQQLVSTEIFKRGVRYYLDGNVVSFDKMMLENWRKYKMNEGDGVSVKIPVLHLLLGRNKLDKLMETIDETAFCDCPYFLSGGGICKHIIATCNHLDNEFLGSKNPIQMDKLIQGSILNNIFKAESSRKVNEILGKFAEFFERSSTNLFWFEKIIFELHREKQLAKDIMSELKTDFEKKLRIYEYEKKIFLLVNPSLRLGGKLWWDFWQSLLGQLSEPTQLKFYSELWGMRKAKLTIDYNQEINLFVRTLPEETKEKILERLKRDYESNTKLWLDFVMSSQYVSFLMENLDKFDAELLIEICPLMPEKRDEIDLKIAGQVRVWSDFLIAGEYDELIVTLTKWSNLGKSETFMESIKYVKESHKKKIKLIKAINKIIEN